MRSHFVTAYLIRFKYKFLPKRDFNIFIYKIKNTLMNEYQKEYYETRIIYDKVYEGNLNKFTKY